MKATILRCFLLSAFFIFINNGLHAASEKADIKDADSSEVSINQHITSPLDSLTAAMFAVKDSHRIADSTWISQAPEFPDSVYEKRIDMLPSTIDLTYNEHVQAFIDLYAVGKRRQVSQMLGLQKLYFPYFGEVLDQKDMPHLLKYLPVVESALNPNAVSRMGATGLWQIMYSTGKFLDMEINSYIDERRNPYISTRKAADYLEGLYKVYGDWLLVIAAYNCGPGNVNKAIYRSGGHHDYWKIRRWLPRETRGYVPAFIAATYVMEYHRAHNIPVARPAYNYLNLDTVHVQKRTDFAGISKYTGMSKKELQFLNPSVKKGIVPASFKGYSLRLPLEVVKAFDTNRDSIYRFSQEIVADKEDDEANEEETQGSDRKGSEKNKAKLYYTVKKGDNLGYIAEWYDCYAQEIRNWNGMYGSRIKPGQKLTIYVPGDQRDQYKKVNNMSFARKQAVEKKQRKGGDISDASASKSIQEKECDCEIYTVKSGDTLWDIARKYDQVTTTDLKEYNNIRYSGAIKPGMELKIKK